MLDAALLKRALQVPMALEDGEEFTDVVTDSRASVPGCLFVALKGEKFDGHRFVAQALEDGARAAVVSEVFLQSETVVQKSLAKEKSKLVLLM